MDDSPGLRIEHDDDALPPELAAAYGADSERDAIDVDKGWQSLRPMLSRAEVGKLRSGMRMPRSRRSVFTIGVVAGVVLAASIVLMLRTGTFLSPGRGGLADTHAQVIATASTASVEYLSAVTDLETALHNGRASLHPQTLAAIAQSLATIDRAIGEAEAALVADPSNEYASEWLATVRSRKLRALRQAVGDIDTVS